MGAVWRWVGRWRAIGVVAMLPLFPGPGMVMVPSVVLGALALRWRTTRRSPRRARWARRRVGDAIMSAFLFGELPAVRAALGVALYVGLVGWLAAMLAVSLRPVRKIAPDRATSTGQNGVMPPGRANRCSDRAWSPALGPDR